MKSTMKEYRNLIDGGWAGASDGETYEIRSPGDTSQIVGRFPLSTAEDVNRAVATAPPTICRMEPPGPF